MKEFFWVVSGLATFATILLFGMSWISQGSAHYTVYQERWISQHESVNHLSYHKDRRTNICFAVNNQTLTGDGAAFTTVPCTPEVENLLGQNDPVK